MRVRVQDYHAFTTWHWDLTAGNEDGNESQVSDEVCGICRVPFDGTCPQCKYPGDECPLVLGAGCTHNFHLHCIMQWLEEPSSKGLCPMCRQNFTCKPSAAVKPSDLEKMLQLIESHRLARERGESFYE